MGFAGPSGGVPGLITFAFNLPAGSITIPAGGYNIVDGPTVWTFPPGTDPALPAIVIYVQGGFFEIDGLIAPDVADYSLGIMDVTETPFTVLEMLNTSLPAGGPYGRLFDSDISGTPDSPHKILRAQLPLHLSFEIDNFPGVIGGTWSWKSIRGIFQVIAPK
jgi:hypothetical protein